MSEKQLPKHIDLGRIGKQWQTLTGQLSLTALSRLHDLLASTQGNVEVDLVVGVDEQGYKFIDGSINTAVDLQCQRCLAFYQQPLKAIFTLSPVSNDQQAKLLPAAYEAIEVVNNSLEIKTIIEDEIILNLPLVPKHQSEQCQSEMNLGGNNGCSTKS